MFDSVVQVEGCFPRVASGGRFAVRVLLLLAAFGWALWGSLALAHPGGLNREGCHNERKTGGYHCHLASRTVSPSAVMPAEIRSLGTPVTGFPSCAAARAAGAAPLRAGRPGYSRKLDRDGDGVACE